LAPFISLAISTPNPWWKLSKQKLQAMAMVMLAATATKKATANLPRKTKDTPELTRFEYTYMQIEREFLVNVSGSKKVMSVQLAVMTHYDDRVFENVKKHDFAIRSAVMDVMRQTTDADLVKPEFRKELAVKIRDSINTLLEKYEDFGGIEEVHFTNFIVQ
jgi:flagellar FliL protein